MLLIEQTLDPRVKRTRQLLVQSFLDLLAEKPIQSITVQDITDRATINRATFYAHFDDKFDLLDYILRESFQTAIQKRLSPDVSFSVENLQILILTVCEHLEQFNSQQCKTYGQYIEPLMEKEVHSQVYGFVLSWITEIQADKPNSAIAPEIVASTISWAIFGSGLQWSRGDKENSVEEISAQILSLITKGLYGSFSLEMLYPGQSVG